MQPSSENKVVLVVRRTRLDDLIKRFNTEDQARFYVEHLGADFSDYKEEDVTYRESVAELGKMISRHARLQVIERDFLPNFIFGERDTVIALGQDGLVANVLKYLKGQQLIGVNPDKHRWEGVLLPFSPRDTGKILPEVFSGKRPLREVTMAEASLNNGQSLLGVNDLFIGPKSHTSARYKLRIGNSEENHSSSGVIVSTGLGSTGWLRSILAGADGIAAAVSGDKPQQIDGSFDWDADRLCFSVREPWPSKNSGAAITFGTITAENPLIIISQMPENGVIFSDGMEQDFLQFNSGTEATIALSPNKGLLVN